jgi:putative peptide zinc metalloprotease protein
MRTMFSQNWYRVAELAPRLRGHVRIHDHQYRGVTWRIIEDRQAQRFHRLTPSAYFVVSMMDGQRVMREIWDLTEARFGSECPTQDEVIHLLAQLHGADLMIGRNLPDLGELDKRASDISRRTLMSRVKNPMAIRLPIFDPDKFLSATLSLVGWMFSPIGGVLWLLLVIAGTVQAVLVWPELTNNLSDQVLSVQNIALLLLVYPIVKAVHELGHAYAVKKWGGEVHEIGIMFLVLLPVPYVDASASLSFREWWRRAIVGGAGILVEVALAAAAILIWAQMEPGLTRAAMFNVALIGSISTVLFNGNPLLRFDGYYVFCDLIGIPNLGTRSNKYLGYLVQRYAFGMDEAENPAVARGERAWFVVYAISAFIYRLTVMLAIGLFVATKFFVVGVLLGILVVFNMALLPILKSLWFVISGRAVSRHRTRAVTVTFGGAALLVAGLFLLPFPYFTVSQGVVWLPENSAVRAGTAGTVAEVIAQPGRPVKAGDPLVRLEDPRLEASLEVQEIHLRGLTLQLAAAGVSDPVSARILKEEVNRAKDELERMRDRQEALVLRAPRGGAWQHPLPDDLVGAFLGRGAVVGHVVSEQDRRLRVVVGQADVDLVRTNSLNVEVRLIYDMEEVIPAVVLREVPAGDRELPSAALSTAGGGPFAIDPKFADRPHALENVFMFDLAVDSINAALLPGARIYARFEHSDAPVAERVWRSVRRLFLRNFNV